MRDIKDLKNKKVGTEISNQLIRTNPKLSGNIKLVVDSKGNVFLSTFDKIPELSSNSMKRFPYNDTKTFGENVSTFIKNTKIEKDSLFKVFESKIDSNIEKTYTKQFDDLYWKGINFKNSSLYEERISCLAPIWLREDSIPDKFIILESKNPFSVNGLTNNISSIQDWINEYNIIKTIDCSINTKIGKILRSIVSNNRWTDDPLFLSYKDNLVEYIGWDIKDGSYTSFIENSIREISTVDHLILEREDILTRGFSRGGIICSNLINIEFLFDVEEYANANRFVGIFCEVDKIDDFIIDENRALLDINENQTKVSWTPDNTSNRITYNTNGIKIYHKQKGYPLLDELDINTKRMFVVEDTNSNLYSIKEPWNTLTTIPNIGTIIDTEFLRIKNTELNISNFCKFTEIFAEEKTSIVKTEQNPICRIKIIKNPIDGDCIRIYKTNLSDPLIDLYTIVASSNITSGNNIGNQFSNLGNIDSVTTSIIKCINYLYDTNFNFGYKAEKISNGELVIYSTVNSSLRDNGTIQLYTSSNDSVFSVIENSYETTSFSFTPSPVLSSPIVNTGILITAKMRSAYGNFCVVSEDFILRMQQSESINNKEFFILKKSNINEYVKITFNGTQYYEDGYFVYDLAYKQKTNKDRIIFVYSDIQIPSSYKFTLYERIKNNIGLISHYPIVDFDFDSYSEEYNTNISGNIDNLLNFLTTGISGINTTTYPNTVNNISIFNEIYGINSEYVLNDKDLSLIDFNINNNKIKNEYNRLQENNLKETALISKVVPWITKWIKRGKDIRNREYRCASGPSFGICNYTPSFKEFSPNPKFHTHEWPLLTGIPPYPISSDSYYEYINGNFNSQDHIDINTYFDNKTIISNFQGIDRELNFLYTEFFKGRTGYYETFFRGVQVRFKKRNTFEPISYNVEGLKIDTGFSIEDYKFISVITEGGPGVKIEITRNDISKSIVCNIICDFFDNVSNKYFDGMQNYSFMDRCQFYTNKSKYYYDSGSNELLSETINISGAILSWTIQNNEFLFFGGTNTITNTDPNFASEIFPNDNGSYNSVFITIGSDILEISGILEVTSTTIRATNFVLNGSIPINVNSTVLGSSATYGYIISALSLGSYTYPGGGSDFYNRISEFISFASLAEYINSGNPEILYRSKLIDGTIVDNDFILELIEPSNVVHNLYLKPEEDERPSTLRNEYGSIGSIISIVNPIESYIFFRYSGFYSPKLKNVINFNIESNLINTLPNSIGRNHRFFEDNIIHTMFYNKVSENAFDSILSGGKTTDFIPLYPKIDEICVNKTNLDLLKNSWDYSILKESLTKNTIKEEYGIFAFPNLKMFLGSVVLLTRNNFTFDIFNDFNKNVANPVPNNLDLLDIKTTKGIYYDRSIDNNYINFTINVDNLLMNYIYEDLKWIELIFNSIIELKNKIENKFGNITNFLKEIIIQEILQRYEVNNVIVYTKAIIGKENYSILTEPFSDINLTDNLNVKLNEYKIFNNFTYNFRNSNKRNFDLKIPSKIGDGLIKSFSFTTKIR